MGGDGKRKGGGEEEGKRRGGGGEEEGKRRGGREIEILNNKVESGRVRRKSKGDEERVAGGRGDEWLT